MKILIDIVHPADVLFFLHPIRRWQQLGHETVVASRSKDVTVELLEAFCIEHHCISVARANLLGLGAEMLLRDVSLLRLARRLRPHVMVGFGGVAISHVGKMLAIPSVSFYDTERAPLQSKVTLPFISHLYVPECYDGPVARNRTSRFPGTKDFSYLHPDNFVPNPKAAVAAGLVLEERNYFIRLVGWQSNHDVGHTGWSAATLERFVGHLCTLGRVHISSELPLPGSLEQYLYRGRVDQVHHLLAYCSCYVGESATMAAEAVLLGVPAIYAASDRRCYTDELAAMGLLWKVYGVEYEALCASVREVAELDQSVLSQRLAAYLEGKPNLADYVVDAVISEAQPGVS